MLLRRIGSKTKLAGKIVPLFPKHKTYIELFFGAGGMFFNKPQAQFNFLNDKDDEVYNLFNVLNGNKDELLDKLELTPIHSKLFAHWQTNIPGDPVLKAIRFLMLSNMSYLGAGSTLRFESGHSKQLLCNSIKNFMGNKNTIYYMNKDFRDVIKSLSFKGKNSDKKNSFIYADPPYLETTNKYKHSWHENDFIDLLDVLKNSGINWAISEFDNLIIKEHCKDYYITKIAERLTIKSRNTEILITNYEINSLFI